MKWFFLTLLLLVIALIIVINTEWGQNFLVRQVTNHFSKELNTKISIQHVDFSLLNRMNIEGVLVKDRQNDTLLYAGRIQVRITDWFIFKDRAELKFIGLENAIINLNRKDSTWNYQFLQDYFSGGSGGGGKQGTVFDIKKVNLKNVYLLKTDQWRGEDMLAQVRGLALDAKEINFGTKKIEINAIDIDKPLFFIKDYTGFRPKKEKQKNEDKADKEAKADSTLQWNIDNWIVHVIKMNIRDGTFKNQKESDSPYYDYFDGRNINFFAINGTFTDLQWNKDTITTNLRLNTKEQSGLEVKSMLADVKFHPKAMEFSNMEIRTNKSVLKNYFAMRYADFNDMGDFIKKVRMESDFTDTEIDSDDIAYFAPDLKSWKKKITITGKISGTVDDLLANNIEVKAGKNTYLKGDIGLSGLPDIKMTFIDFKANEFRTTYADAVTFFPYLRKINYPNLQRISYLNFDGSFTGFIRDFVTFGTIKTNLGSIKSDLNMKLPVGKAPVYSGTIATNGFHIGEFLNDPSLGSVSFDGKVKGLGLQWNTLSAEVDANIRSVEYKNYHYENIIAKGSLKNKLFNGNATVKDTNVVFDLEGVVDLSGKIPRFDFIADVKKINLKELNLSKDNFAFSGKLDFDFSSSNIDNFLGDATVTNAIISKDGKDYPLDSLAINAKYVDNEKHLVIHTGELDGYVKGEYNITGLPDAFKLFLNKYYPSYIQAPGKKNLDESFSFDISTRYIDKYLALIDTNIGGLNNSHFSGFINMAQNQLRFDADISGFNYKQYQFQNIEIKSKGDLEKFELNTIVDNISLSDTIHFPYTRLNVIAHNDLSDIDIITVSNIKTLPGARVKAQVQTYSDGIGLRFDSSRFIVNDKIWSIEKNGELEFRSNTMSHGSVIVKEGNQEIQLHTRPSDIGNWNDLIVEMKNIIIGDISPYFVKDYRLDGAISGNVTVEDPLRDFNLSANLQVNEFRVDDDSIGQVNAVVSFSNKTGELKVNGKNADPNEKLGFDVALFLKDPENKIDDQIKITAENYKVKIVQRFISTLFSDLHGYTTGTLSIIGDGDNTRYVGKMKLHDAGLRVKYTQCYYKILDTEIEFKPGELDLGKLTILDTVTKNTASLTTGILKHDNWKNLQFNIQAVVDNKPMLLLNTGSLDNTSFYGKAFGTGSFSLTGPESDMKLRIFGVASEQDSSTITIPPYESRETGIAEFLVERKYGRELTDSAFKKGGSNISYYVDLTANPHVTMRVVLDELTKDEIVGRGEGNMVIAAGSSEPLSMRGRFNLTDGKYVFTFQSLFKKPFILKKDANNFIEWSGDPYKANIHIEAQYTASNVSFAPLANSFSLDNRVLNKREDVYITVLLTKDLFAPDISFRLEFPDNSIAVTDQAVAFIIQQLTNNQNEMNKQVSYLIVFNSFAPVENGLSGSGSSFSSALSEFATSTVSGLISNVINNELNQILGKILKNNQYRVNFSGSLYNKNPLTQNGNAGFALGSNWNVSLTGPLFTNRILFTVGGGIDAPLQSDIQQDVKLLPDITIEILINKSGTIRATFFHKQNIDYLTGAAGVTNTKTQRTGASLSFKKDFYHIRELFTRKKRIRKAPDETEPAEKVEE